MKHFFFKLTYYQVFFKSIHIFLKISLHYILPAMNRKVYFLKNSKLIKSLRAFDLKKKKKGI